MKKMINSLPLRSAEHLHVQKQTAKLSNILASLLFATAILFGGISYGQIAAWDFTGESNGSTSTAEVYNSNLDAGNMLTRGSGASASTASNSFRTTGFSNDGVSVSNNDYFETTISDDANCTVRVRIKKDKGFITIKGKTEGISRSEYEYQIPLAEANQMIEEFCERKIIKERFEIPAGKHTWEVDVFQGKLAPLIIAEIELDSEDEAFDLPEWVGKEVSGDPQYYNSRLIAL